jgi:hypothetical protein
MERVHTRVSILFETKNHPIKESKQIKDIQEAYLTDFSDMSVFKGKNPVAVDPGHSDLIFCQARTAKGRCSTSVTPKTNDARRPKQRSTGTSTKSSRKQRMWHTTV